MEKPELLEVYKKQQNLVRALYSLKSELEKRRSSLNKKIGEVSGHLESLIYSEVNPAQQSLFGDVDKFLIEAEEFIKKFDK